MSKVSVITTVWNVEEWLDRNIQAFLNQTLKDSELILVNDCSPDNSKNIIAKYDDARIKVINNSTNVGPGVSRQIGIDNSCGEYTIFVDGDDWLESNCLEIMYNEAIKQKADIVSCKTLHHDDYGIINKTKKGNTYAYINFIDFINNKLIKRSIWSKTNYSPLRFREDINTLFRCLEFSNKSVRINYVGYHYNVRPNSLTTTPNVLGKSYIYETLSVIENLEFFKNKNIQPSKIYERCYNLRQVIVNYNIAKNILKEDINIYKEECEIIDKFIKDNINFKKYEKKNRRDI